jgi:5-formyltetrahydrofolate cyclo-ligase
VENGLCGFVQGIFMDKIQMRTEIKQVLTELKPADRITKSKKACHSCICTRQYIESEVIMVFLSLPHEVDTAPLILDAWQKGKTVAVPKVSWQQRNMIPVELNSLESGLAVGTYGLRNPTTGVPVTIEEIDMVIAPGLGFDKEGGRIGRGGAYYDQFFCVNGLKAIKAGLCFSEQVFDEVPMDKDDQKLDMLITDTEVLEFIRTS